MSGASAPPSPEAIVHRYLSAYRQDDIGIPHIRRTLFLPFFLDIHQPVGLQ